MASSASGAGDDRITIIENIWDSEELGDEILLGIDLDSSEREKSAQKAGKYKLYIEIRAKKAKGTVPT